MSARFGQRALRLFFRCLGISGGCCLDNHERFFDVFLSSSGTFLMRSAGLSEEPSVWQKKSVSDMSDEHNLSLFFIVFHCRTY